jgi:hypothetical protein
MIDIMFDIETLGVGGNNVVLSAACVPFDMISGKTYLDESFYERINVQHSLNEGFSQRQLTVEFWNRQPKIVRDREFGGTATIKEFCQSFSNYFDITIRKRWKTFNVWSTAPKLDFGSIYNLYLHISEKYPIPYTAERCARTIRGLTKNVCDNHSYENLDHHPINDCVNQIDEIVAQNKHITIL